MRFHSQETTTGSSELKKNSTSRCQKYDNSPTALKNKGHQQKGLAVQKLSIKYERASSMKIPPQLPQGQGSQDH